MTEEGTSAEPEVTAEPDGVTTLPEDSVSVPAFVFTNPPPEITPGLATYGNAAAIWLVLVITVWKDPAVDPAGFTKKLSPLAAAPETCRDMPAKEITPPLVVVAAWLVPVLLFVTFH